MRARRFALGALALATVLGRAAGAQETGLEAADDELPIQYEVFYFGSARYQLDNGDRTGPEDIRWDPTGEDFGEISNIFGGSISYKEFQLSLQVDSVVYVHRPTAADNASQFVRNRLESRYEDVLRLEFFSVSYSGRTFDVTLGDFYVTLGRGMLLSIRKVGDVGVDNKLRGGEARVRIGPVTAHVFGGFLNIRNYEVGQGFFYPETVPGSCSDVTDALAVCENGMDVIGGARLEYRYSKYVRVGVHGALIDTPDVRNDTDTVLARNDTNLRGYGATIEFPRPFKWMSAYFEGVRLERDRPEQGDDVTEPGQGLYGNINLFIDRLTVLIEGKAYDNLFNMSPRAYSTVPEGTPESETATRQVINRILEPPTAERPFTRILANNTNVGGHLRVDYSLTRKTVPFVGGGYARDRSFSVPTNIYFGYGGLRTRWTGGEASVNGGYRAQLNDGDTPELEGTVFRNDAHLRFDVSFDVGGPYSLELFGDTFHVNFSPTQGGEDTGVSDEAGEWLEGRLSVSLRSRDGWSLTGAYEFYTQTPDRIAPHYPSLAGQWDFVEGGILRVFVGGERAGLKCSGGVCRFFPGFEGGRLELVLRL